MCVDELGVQYGGTTELAQPIINQDLSSLLIVLKQ